MDKREKPREKFSVFGPIGSFSYKIIIIMFSFNIFFSFSCFVLVREMFGNAGWLLWLKLPENYF
jgi:hypothetical protein